LNEENNETTSKLLIDNEKDFKFHLAYLAYSSAWDENDNDEARKKLNNLVKSLSDNKSSYQTFYMQLKRFRADDSLGDGSGRSKFSPIQTQRKREWQANESKRSRNVRHRKR
jgi:hypothetical protein